MLDESAQSFGRQARGDLDRYRRRPPRAPLDHLHAERAQEEQGAPTPPRVNEECGFEWPLTCLAGIVPSVSVESFLTPSDAPAIAVSRFPGRMLHGCGCSIPGPSANSPGFAMGGKRTSTEFNIPISRPTGPARVGPAWGDRARTTRNQWGPRTGSIVVSAETCSTGGRSRSRPRIQRSSGASIQRWKASARPMVTIAAARIDNQVIGG
jgi:hypothetical protein